VVCCIGIHAALFALMDEPTEISWDGKIELFEGYCPENYLPSNVYFLSGDKVDDSK
jgi:hypothetical protein